MIIVDDDHFVTLHAMASILPRFGLLLAAKLFFRRFVCVKLANMIPFLFVRIFLYRVMGVRIGRDVYIGFDVELDTNHPEMITIKSIALPEVDCWIYP